MTTSLLLDARQAAAYLGVSERMLYELRKRPEFAAPVQLAERVVRYRRADLEQFVESQARARSIPEPRQLAAGKARRKNTPPAPAPGADLQPAGAGIRRATPAAALAE